MTAPSENPDVRHYRRKRRFQGAIWTPGTISADSESGIWCKFHKMRHGYKTRQLGVSFEKGSNGKFKALWYCNETGTVLQEMELNNGSF